MTHPWMQLCLTTALGISLAGCATTGSQTAAAAPQRLALPAYQQQRAQDALASGGKAQSEDRRIAALAPMAPAPAPQGLVLLRRTEPVDKPLSPEEIDAKIQRLTDEAIAAKQGELDSRLATAEQRANFAAGLTLTQMEQLKADTAHQLALVKQEVDYKAQLAELNASKTAMEQARLEARRAEDNSKQFVVAEVGSRETATTAKLGEMSAKLEALAAINNVKLDAARQTTASQLAALRDVQNAQAVAQMQALRAVDDSNAARAAALKETTANGLAMLNATDAARHVATGARLDALQQGTSLQLQALKESTNASLAAADTLNAERNAQTQQRLEDLAQLTSTNQRLMAAETRRMGKVLTEYSDAQISNLAAQTDDTIRRVAAIGQLNVDRLRAQTSERLSELHNDAAEQASAITKATELKIASRVAAAQEENEQKRLKPQQVKDIAQSTVQESAPQFRALALQTLSDSQDYIRTVARTAVADDPQTKTALRDAARDVITKDNQIVFAIRKVVDARLKTLPLAVATAPASTVPGSGSPDLYTGDKVSLDSSHLGVAAIANDPGLAGIEPAAGPDGMAVGPGGVQVANAQAPSMMRASARHDWVDLRKFHVVVHEDSKGLQQLVNNVVTKAEPYVGPWEIKWKISNENRDLLQEKFSLDAETTFEEFVNYLANYMVNDRGIKLTFSLFDAERVLVISD